MADSTSPNAKFGKSADEMSGKVGQMLAQL
jgi:hypothetical protein